MAYSFQVVEVIAFDAHTAIKPLAFPQFVKTEFKFLVDQEQYGQRYKSWQAVETDSFTIRPIKKQEFSHNHFWRNYAAKSFGPDRDYWGLQIPFIFEPKNLDLKINAEGLPLPVELKYEIYLNSMGWSSNVRIGLTGEIKSDRLREFVGRLRGSDGKTSPFLIAGKGQSLTSVFKVLGGVVRNGIYTAPDTVGDIISVSNQLIISLAQTTSPPKYFKEEWNTSPRMNDGERAEMLGILYGRDIKLEENKVYLDKTLVTRFKGTNFSLTNYDLGTLLYMQEEAVAPAPKTESLCCLAANVRTSTMMSLAMDSFDQSVSKSPKSDPALNALQKQVQAALRVLPDSYKNSYYQNFYRHHKRLKKLFLPDESEEKVVEE